MRTLITLVVALSIPAASTTSQIVQTTPSTTFVLNAGQWDADILAATAGRGGALQVRHDGLWVRSSGTPGAAHLAFGSGSIPEVAMSGAVVPVNLYGPGPRRLEGLLSSSTLDFAIGAGQWLTLETRADGVAFRLEVDPAGPGSSVPITFDRRSAATIDDTTLTAVAAGGSLRLDLRSARSSGRDLDATWRHSQGRIVAIDVPAWDGRAPLTIEGDLVWATFLGGSAVESFGAVRLLADESVLVAGTTTSLDFPVTRDAAQPVAGLGLSNAFITRLSPDGGSILYSTYLTHDDSRNAIGGHLVVDGLNRAAVVGWTKVQSLPVTANALQPVHAGGNEGFIAEIDLATGSLDYLSYLGRSGADVIKDGLYTNEGRLVVVGKSNSADYPVTSGVIQETKSTFFDAVITILDTSLAPSQQLVASTFVGGTTSGDEFEKVLLDSSGNLIVAGTISASYPIPPSAYDPGPWLSPSEAPYVARITADLKSIESATLLKHYMTDLAINSFDDIAFCSWTAGVLPTTPGAYDETPNGFNDIYVGVLSPDLDALAWATMLGGDATDAGLTLAIDDLGTVIVGGNSRSDDFPTTPGALDTENSGGIGDPVVSVLTNHGSTLGYSTFVGGSTNGAGFVMDVQSLGGGEFVIGGKAASADHPATPGAFDEDWNEVFIARFSVDLTWAIVGPGLAGSAGAPILTGLGGLGAGETTTLEVKRALASSTAWLVIGLTKLSAPFKQGVLVPSPDLVLGGIPIDALGKTALTFAWPSGIPAGLATFYQMWVADPAAPVGLSATNGLQALAP